MTDRMHENEVRALALRTLKIGDAPISELYEPSEWIDVEAMALGLVADAVAFGIPASEFAAGRLVSLNEAIDDDVLDHAGELALGDLCVAAALVIVGASA